MQAGYRFDLLHGFWIDGLSIKVQIGVQSMEQQDVQASDTIPFIEAECPLLVQSLCGFEVRPVDGGLERQA